MASSEKTRLNLSIDSSLDKRSRFFMIENDIRTLSRLVEMALVEYLDNHSGKDKEGGDNQDKDE